MFTKKDAPATSAPDLGNLAQAGVTMHDPSGSLGLQEAAAAAKNAVPPKISAPGLLTPEMQGFMNASISAAVKEVFASMAPLLQSIALTPEKIAEAEKIRRMPTEDELLKKAREAREKKLMHEEQEANRQNLLRNQSLCPHKYPTGTWAVSPVNNYPDRQPRFLCALCQTFFEPRRWVINAPDADNLRGKAVVVDEHPQYKDVSQVLATKGI